MSFPQIGLEALLKDAAFNQGVKGFMGSVDRMTDKSVSGAGAISRAFAGMGKAGLLVAASAVAAVGAAAVGAAAYLRSAIGPASDLAETISKVGIVFGTEGAAVLKWSENSAKAMGMTRNDALAAAGTYGNLFRAMGMTETASSDMSMELIELASDLASFNNMNPTEVLEKLRAGLTGESEPLKSLGVNINETIIKEEALTAGIWDGTGALTAAQKATASYRLIMRQTSLAQGDFARTSGGLANQQRILAATMANLKAKIGTALLPAITGITAKISEMANSPAFGQFIDKIGVGLGNVATWITNDFVPGIGEAISRISTFIADIANGDSLAGSIRVLLAGVFDEGKVEGLIDVTKWVQAVYNAGAAGDWTSVGTMMWGKILEGAGKVADFGTGLIDSLRGSLAGGLGLKDYVWDEFGNLTKGDTGWGAIGAEIWARIVAGFGEAKYVGSKMIDSLRTSIGTALGMTTTAYQDTAGKWIENAVGWEDIGGEIWARISAGMAKMASAGMAFGSDIVDNLRNSIGKALGMSAVWNTDVLREGVLEDALTWEEIGAEFGKRIVAGIISYFSTSWADYQTATAELVKASRSPEEQTKFQQMGRQAALDFTDQFKVTTKEQAAVVAKDWASSIGTAIANELLTNPAIKQAVLLWNSIFPWTKGFLGGISPLGNMQFEDTSSRAAGGWASGLTKVGERGPELVNLPAGSYVHSNAESQRMSMAAIGGTTVYDIRVNIAGGTSAQVRQSSKIGVLEALSAKGVK
jgi:hypothetical protein